MVNKEKIDAVVKQMLADGYAAGSSTLVIENGKEVYFQADGYADIGNKVPVKRDTIFRLYSMSKPITGAAVMLLVEDGLLELNSPVSTYIPEFANQTYIEGYNEYPVKRDMKVRDLLNMTAGFTYPGVNTVTEIKTDELTREGILRLNTDNEMTTLEFAKRMARIPLKFSPGSEFCYSYCADILGALVEVVSGKKFGEFMKERIFDPCDMKDTGFFVPKEKQDRLTKVYEQTPEGLKEYHYNNLLINLEMAHPPKFESGGAGLVSTLDDYAHFGQMLLNKGVYDGKRVMNEGTVKFFTQADMDRAAEANVENWDGLNGFSYANLLRIMKKPEKAVVIGSKGEYGWDGWLGPYFANDPEHNLTLVHMLQRTDSGTTPYLRRMRNVIFSGLE